MQPPSGDPASYTLPCPGIGGPCSLDPNGATRFQLFSAGDHSIRVDAAGYAAAQATLAVTDAGEVQCQATFKASPDPLVIELTPSSP